MNLSSSLWPSDRVLRVNNVARRLGAPERTVRYWAATGQLAAFRLTPKIWGFRLADVERFGAQRAFSRVA